MPEERKLVTILFADVTGSTSLGETLDPEDVRALMGRYYAHAQRIVSHHEGTIEKFIGDAVMAVFGLPQAHGDDAERALASALALRDAVANDEILNTSFQLRIAVNTGEVVTTSDASRGDFLVTGDAVNVAARLQQHTHTGEIVAGSRTAHAAQTAFLFDEPRLVKVKGKREPIQIFPLKGIRTTRTMDRPPLVGRKQDLLQLALLKERVLEEQHPQLVSIVAPAGTGKTRLLEEFLSRLDPDEGLQIAIVRCLPYGQTLTYWPLRGLLDGLLGGEIDKPHVMSVFEQGGYNPDDASRLADLVLATLGIDGDGSIGTTDRESIFTAWRLLIEVFSSLAPRIIIFEDLHWASESMLDLVEHLTHVRILAPLLLISLSRPELLDRRPNWGGGRQNFTSLALQPLTAKQTHDLVEKLTSDLSESMRQQIVERSGGNPFFALELIRGLTERRLNGDEAPLDMLPDTIHAAVLARLDLLSPIEHQVLQVASVASRTIGMPMLQAVLNDYDPQEIAIALDELQTHDILVPMEANAFTFRHILFRDVAYGTLSRAERIRLHGRIAAWLESAAAEHLDEYAEVIAYHYREAVILAHQSAIPQALPLESERALHFLRRAGEIASRAGAYAEAQDFLRSAIALAPENELLSLYEQFGDSDLWTQSSIDSYWKAFERWRTIGATQPIVGARLLRKILITYTRGSVAMPFEQQRFMELWQEVQHLALVAGDEGEQWRVQSIDFFYLINQEDTILPEEVEAKKKIAEAAATYFEQRADWTAFSEILDGYAALLLFLGAYHDALMVLKRRLSAPGLSVLERGDAIQMIARTYAESGDYENCIATIQEALTQVKPGQTLRYLGLGISLAIAVAFITGRWTTLETLAKVLEEVQNQIQFDGDSVDLVTVGYYSILQVALAREDSASVNTATAILKRIFPDVLSDARVLLTTILEDDAQKADFERLDWSIPSKKLRMATLLLVFCSERGKPVLFKWIEHIRTAHWSNNEDLFYCDIAQALADDDNVQLAQAIDAAEAYHLIVHATRMRIVLAQRTGKRTHLERARTVLEPLQDRQFLRRLEEVKMMLDIEQPLLKAE